MKIKKDFITNSSSTSFVAYGITKEFDDFRKNNVLLKELYKLYKEDHEDVSFEEFKDLDNYILYEYFDSYMYKREFILSYASQYESDVVYIDGSFDKMKDDETLREFKQKILEELNKIGFKVDKLEYIEESWRDG